MLCSQTLQVVREEVQQALCVHALTRGQLDFDESLIIKPHKRPVVKDDISGERIYSDPVRGTQSQGFKKSSTPLPPNAFFLSKVTQEINFMSPEFCSLAYYAYSDDAKWRHTEIVASYVWQRFLEKQTKSIRKKKSEILKNMVFLAMQNWRKKILTDIDLHKPKRIRELLNINEHHWVRDWLPHWNSMHQILDGVDQKVLTEVFYATNTRRIKRTA